MSAMTPNEIVLQDCVERLAFALTGKAASRSDHMIEQLLRGQEYYLPDGGYSRIVVSVYTGKAALTSNSRVPVIEEWKKNSGLVAELERLVDLVRRDEQYDHPGA